MNLDDFCPTISGLERAPWIIFIHGLMGSHANWRKITPAFEKNYRVLTYDQRGHGKNIKGQKGFAPEDYASDLLYLMEKLSISKATLVGHSMGGRTAMCFSSKNPGRVERLIIEDIGPEFSKENGILLAEKLKQIPVPFATKQMAKEYLMNDFKDPKLGSFLYTAITTNDSGEAIWKMNMSDIIETIEKGRSVSRWDEWEKINVPTLVIRGEKSEELTQEELNQMLARNKNAKGVEIADAGHWVHFDQPQAFIEACRTFLLDYRHLM